MNDKNPEERLEDQVKRFLEVYKVLSPEARVTFEIEIAKKTAVMDERTKNLYNALVKAAREGLSQQEAIEQMRKVE